MQRDLVLRITPIVALVIVVVLSWLTCQRWRKTAEDAIEAARKANDAAHGWQAIAKQWEWAAKHCADVTRNCRNGGMEH